MKANPPENEKLAGTWKLVSACSTTSNGERNETPYGTDPVGFLTYTKDGWVSVLISYGGRKRLHLSASVEEQAEAFKTFFGYAGRFTCKGGQITHKIEVSSIQNYVGKDLIRTVKFEKGRIVLATPPMIISGKVQTVELIWQSMSVGS